MVPHLTNNRTDSQAAAEKSTPLCLCGGGGGGQRLSRRRLCWSVVLRFSLIHSLRVSRRELLCCEFPLKLNLETPRENPVKMRAHQYQLLLLLLLTTCAVVVLFVGASAAADAVEVAEELASETAPIHHLVLHKGCRSNTSKSDVVRCFQTCWDESVVSRNYRAAYQLQGKTVNITDFMWARRKAGKNRFGCFVGCLTNTPLTTCKAKCTPPLTHFVGEACVYNQSIKFLDPTTDRVSDDVKNCYASVLNTTSEPISLCDRSTNGMKNNNGPFDTTRAECIDSIDSCFAQLNLPAFNKTDRTLHNFNLCIEYKQMEKHLTAIQTNNDFCNQFIPRNTTATAAATGSLQWTCDEALMAFLPNEVCEKTCVDTTPPHPFDECVVQCDTKTYPLCYESCVTEVDCFEDCTKDPVAPPPPGGGGTTTTTTTPPTTTPPAGGRRKRRAAPSSANSRTSWRRRATKGASAGSDRQTLRCFAKCAGHYDQLHVVRWENRTDGDGSDGPTTTTTTKVGLTERQVAAAELCKMNASRSSLVKVVEEYVVQDTQRAKMFPGYNGNGWNDFTWLFAKKTPEECKLDCDDGVTSTVDQRKYCLDDASCTLDLSEDTRERLCDENPLRLKTVILYALTLELPMDNKSVEATYAFGGGGVFGGKYTFQPNDTARNKMFFDLLGVRQDNNTHCHKDCKNSEEYGLANAECAIGCFKSHKENCEYNEIKTVELSDFSTCQWRVNLAYTPTPSEVLGTYFNDKPSYDEKDKLERPETTQFLDQTKLKASTGFFVFPYFVILRATCDEGNYDDAFYRLLMSGTYPPVHVQYYPSTARDHYQSSLTTEFEAALINLKREPKDILVPVNPLEQGDRDDTNVDADWCHLRICYPAFAIPLPMYQLPIFDVVVGAQDVFEGLRRRVYVTLFHVSQDGSGELYMSDVSLNVVSVPTPDDFFPSDRVNSLEDTQLWNYEEFCRNSYCPPITDDDPEHAFIDHEDILEAHFTFPTAPQIAIAGFYSPNLLIIGDPDMNKFDLVNWTIPTQKNNISIFGSDNPCIFTEEDKNGLRQPTTKPMYSKIDNSDPGYPINYYRIRYKLQDYAAEPNGHGIFDVIALQDRFILVTANGVVSMYGNTIATLRANKAFKVEEGEKLRRCFKFMRTGRRVQSTSDMVVGVTYDYTKKINEDLEEVKQEIWVGRLGDAGETLRWIQLKSSAETAGDEDVEYVIPAAPDSGMVLPISPGKPLATPDISTDSFSEVERICFKVYKERMNLKDVHLQHHTDGWCEALDASPVVTETESIQLLIRMTVLFVGPGTIGGSGVHVVFYILVSHTVEMGEGRGRRNEQVLWAIDNVIPRIPCITPHKESVYNLLTYDETYFTVQGPHASGGAKDVGCHVIFGHDSLSQYHVYISRLTYTAAHSDHLFLYGAGLIQSTDGGKSFVTMLDFPHHDNFLLKNGSVMGLTEQKPFRLKHRIVTMAFGQTGGYAFLTNHRELWIGSTGTVQQIRLRPSPGYSATQTLVSHSKGLQDGIPFALFYDSNNQLFEMVTLHGKKGHVDTVTKRTVPVYLIIRQNKLQTAIATKIEAFKEANEMPKFIAFSHSDTDWYLYCPFSEPKFTENYTEKYSRNQLFSFVAPVQHPSLSGNRRDLNFKTLITYQVVSFSLLWKSFFDEQHVSYAKLDRDPFHEFLRTKEENSTIGQIRYLSIGRDGNYGKTTERALSDGIVVFPHEYHRLIMNEPSRTIQPYYYIDYGQVLRLQLKFTVKNPSSLANTDYFKQQISQIQMNVDIGNGSLLVVDTDKDILSFEASVEFDIHISVIKSENLLLEQSEPGKNLIPVPILIHMIGGFGKCVQSAGDNLIQDTFATTIYVGCQPATDIIFNWNKTLHSIRFRDKKKHYGTYDDCYGNELVCFFARMPMVIFFDVFDTSKQAYIPYRGNYVMRVIGGGYTNKSITSYQRQEIDAYNIPGVSDVSLIWNEWNLTSSKKVERKANIWKDQQKTAPHVKDTHREVVLQSGKSAIQWACHTLSPCARISPNIKFETVYWFQIQVTNKGVDNSTLCLFNKNFTIMLYGFPPSPETQLITTILFCVCMIGILYLLFICLRGHKRVWRNTKIKLYGWFQIVKDTFPKPLKKHQTEVVVEGHTQQEKDNIILSLQGHLKIPPLIARTDSTGGGEGTRESKQGSATSVTSSLASMESTYSSQSRAEVIHPVAGRHGAATWTDMVYEQIIAKRLSAIVDKNNKMRQNILRRASVHDAEHERNYENTHKRTVSQESIFNHPTNNP